MGPRAYYNEHDRYAAAWLRNLIAEGLIAPGDVDERDIRDVHADDLRGYRQAHFFAGIGVWSGALRDAGWPDSRPVWTGSCPCQPFSAAGRGKGFADERHLWPAWHHLIRQRRPAIVFGEQVASRDGLAWLDLVSADMEADGYAIGATDLPAAGVGAPHRRQRLWFVADAHGRHAGAEREQPRGEHRQLEEDGRAGAWRRAADRLADAAEPRRPGRLAEAPGPAERGRQREPDGCGVPGGLDDAVGVGRGAGRDDDARHVGFFADATGEPRGLGDPGGAGLPARERAELLGPDWALDRGAVEQPGRAFWASCDWLLCRDGKARPVESGTFPLANGDPARVGRLRAYGNAITRPAATAFIRAADAAMADAECVRLGGLFD